MELWPWASPGDINEDQGGCQVPSRALAQHFYRNTSRPVIISSWAVLRWKGISTSARSWISWIYLGTDSLLGEHICSRPVILERGRPSFSTSCESFEKSQVLSSSLPALSGLCLEVSVAIKISETSRSRVEEGLWGWGYTRQNLPLVETTLRSGRSRTMITRLAIA